MCGGVPRPVGPVRLGAGTSLVVQWLRLCASTAGGVGLIPGGEDPTCCAPWPKKEKKTGGCFSFHLVPPVSGLLQCSLA